MRDVLKSLAKKVTLELIYEAVDERTAEIKTRLDKIEEKLEKNQEETNRKFDAINSRIDQLFSIILNLSEKHKEK